MKKLYIVVATRNRYEKLLRMLKTLPAEADGIPLSVLICFDADALSMKKITEKTDWRYDIKVYLSPLHRGSVFCRNFLLEKTDDAVLYATDDITFRKDSIRNAIQCMKRRFPDEDGVIGFKLEGVMTYHPSGIALVGNPFLNRYPERHLFFPGYFHFACQEIQRAGSILNKFYLCENAIAYHFHPDKHPKERDSTHADARIFKARDMKLSADRKARGETWGIGL